MTHRPFLRAARTETMLRDWDRLRRAIHAHGGPKTEAAWERCERWLGCDMLAPLKAENQSLRILVTSLSNRSADPREDKPGHSQQHIEEHNND